MRSEKGHGGGWTLARDLAKVTLRDIYAALGQPSLLAIGNRTEAPGCLVEQAVNAALDQAFDDAEALLLSRLGEVTLAMLSADFHDRLVARGNGHRLEIAHARDAAVLAMLAPFLRSRGVKHYAEGRRASCPASPTCTA